MSTASEIAAHIINLYADQYKCDYLKIQECLFFCQALSLIVYDVPLFEDNFEAGIDGPIISSVKEKHRRGSICGLNVQLTDQNAALVKNVVDALKNHTGKEINISSREHRSPWSTTRQKYKISNEQDSKEIIEHDVIKSNFLLSSVLANQCYNAVAFYLDEDNCEDIIDPEIKRILDLPVNPDQSE